MSEAFAVFMLGLLIGLTAAIPTAAMMDDNWKQSAIRHGAAEYRLVNPQTGEVKFMWRDEK